MSSAYEHLFQHSEAWLEKTKTRFPRRIVKWEYFNLIKSIIAKNYMPTTFFTYPLPSAYYPFRVRYSKLFFYTIMFAGLIFIYSQVILK